MKIEGLSVAGFVMHPTFGHAMKSIGINLVLPSEK